MTKLSDFKHFVSTMETLLEGYVSAAAFSEKFNSSISAIPDYKN